MPAPWPKTPAELKAAHCWFPVDRVAHHDDVTDFKRRARWQQAWWRDSRQLPCGTHRPDVVPPVYNGSHVDLAHAQASGCNFLSDRIRDAVRARVAAKERYETLKENRLWMDLLSSMPLCFNLFGELHEQPARLRNAVEVLWPDAPGEAQTLRFEWSPGRWDKKYLNNRSAFDAAIILGLPDGRRGVIGIETKYHEDIKKPKKPPDEKTRMPRYREVTERSGLLPADWETKLKGTDLEQFWLDHLLVLAMLQHPDRQWAWGRFVIVHPAANPSVRGAARRYGELLTSHETFEVRTIEELLDADVLHEPETAQAFRERYHW